VLIEILTVITPVIACALIGFIWAKSGHEYPSEFVSKLVFNVGAPCLIVSSISQVQLSVAALWSMALATLICLASVGMVAWVIIRLLGHEPRILLVSMAFPNVGNMGLPLCLFAFGETGLALAVAYFMIISIAHFSVGMAIATGESIRWRTFFRNPVLWAIAIACGLVGAEYTLPQAFANSLSLVGQLTIPMMLITLGVSLASIQVSQWQQGLFYSALRIVLGGTVAFGVSQAMNVTDEVRNVLILQGVMPVAVFNYLFALRSGRQVQTVASLVFISTFLSILILPFVLAFLIPSAS